MSEEDDKLSVKAEKYTESTMEKSALRFLGETTLLKHLIKIKITVAFSEGFNAGLLEASKIMKDGANR